MVVVTSEVEFIRIQREIIYVGIANEKQGGRIMTWWAVSISMEINMDNEEEAIKHFKETIKRDLDSFQVSACDMGED